VRCDEKLLTLEATGMSDTTISSLSVSQFYQPAITFTGLGSGIDSTSIINQLVEVESAQIYRFEAWKEDWTAKIAALQELENKLQDLRTTTAAMNTVAKFAAKSASVSNSTILSATAASTATAGTHQLLVNQLAQNEVEVHQGLAAGTTVVNSSGSSKVFAFSYAGGASVSISVADGATLTDLAALINNSGANPGVTATVLDMGDAYTTDRYRLMLTGNDTGTAKDIAIDDGLTTLDGTGGTVDFTSAAFTETQSAQNAQLRLDGYPPSGWIERSSNTVSDVLSGVTLNLLSTSATAVQVTVTNDTAAMQEEILELVDSYNQTISYIREQTGYDAETGVAGVLFGNYAVLMVKGALAAIATGNAPGFRNPPDSYLNLGAIGITTDADETSPTFGQLLVDESTLSAALSADINGVVELLSDYFVGVSDDATGTITYYSSLPGITQPGIYDVEATVTGGVLVSGTINGHAATVDGDTLTGTAGFPEYGLAVRVNLVDGTHTGTVRLKLGLNGEFSEKLDDLLSLTSGPLNILIDNYEDIVTNIDKKIEFEQRRVEAYRQRLIDQFSRLEALLAQLNDQSTYLEGQINKLPGISS
jgi:flagellar hook-associated protein 2